MTPTKEQIEAETDAAEAIVDRMCQTYRHDYGLLEAQEREGLRRVFSQIARHDIRPALATARLEGEAKVREQMEAENERLRAALLDAKAHLYSAEITISSVGYPATAKALREAADRARDTLEGME